MDYHVLTEVKGEEGEGRGGGGERARDIKGTCIFSGPEVDVLRIALVYCA